MVFFDVYDALLPWLTVLGQTSDLIGFLILAMLLFRDARDRAVKALHTDFVISFTAPMGGYIGMDKPSVQLIGPDEIEGTTNKIRSSHWPLLVRSLSAFARLFPRNAASMGINAWYIANSKDDQTLVRKAVQAFLVLDVIEQRPLPRGLATSIGVALVLGGFALQIVGSWPRP